MVTIQTFNGSGADCSGSSGDANRVLTLSNTGTTIQSGMLVYASGLALALTTEYTVSHKSSSTEITFLNRLWDDMTIVVNYYFQEPDSDSLINPYIDEYGEVVTLIRKSDKTYSDWGDESNTETRFGNIKAVFNVYGTDALFTTEGRFNNGDLTFFFKSTQDYRDISSKVERANGDTYEIKDVRAHGMQGGVQVREALVNKV